MEVRYVDVVNDDAVISSVNVYVILLVLDRSI